MDTIVYIDGLNLYYGCAKGTDHKWIDVKLLIQKTLGRKNNIIKIKYFTAIVKPTKSDPNVDKRQQIYLKALKAYIPELEIIYGHFSEHIVNMALAKPDGKKKRFVDVIKREEKGSDVNLAVHFLNDALNEGHTCSVIVSNDSDLAEAVRLVREQTTKSLGLLSPFSDNISKELSQYCHFYRKIKKSTVRQSQLPDVIPDTVFNKPDGW